ncbi:amidase [Zhengella sp. ZM62]|uniref:amidase n=1 Tax=Zhengella sedimenti TaxID=3390035 RepID=UPI00397487AF
MLSVREICEAVASGRKTANAALLESLAAIEAGDADLQAFTCIASRDAVEADANQAKGPLAGIALGVKDIFDTADLPTAYGSSIYAGWQPRADAAVVAMARKAGASVIGKTVTTEFAFFQPGPTVNPHDRAHTPGGSSSGSAAAVAAGMIPAALGTQTGGSVIRPAAFCGVAGYKPGFRLAPATGMKTFSWTLDTTGFFAASVDDVALVAARVLERDLEPAPVDPGTLRIGLYRTAIWNEADEVMREAVEDAAARFQHAGAAVVEVVEPEVLAEARSIHPVIQDHEAARALCWEHMHARERLSPKLLDCLDRGAGIPAAEYDTARSIARRARKAATSLFEHVDVLLTPSAPGPAPHGLQATGDPKFNKLWTLTGNPCVNLPGLTTEKGLPLGVQMVGRFGRDKLLLSVAHWAERLL